jgi:hypothetical protein
MLRVCQCLILGKRQTGAEFEIRKSPLVQHPVDDDGAFFHLEIEAVVLRPEAVQHPPIAVDLAEAFTRKIVQILLTHLEFLKQFELLECSQFGKLGGTDFVENNLKHPRRLTASPGFASAKITRSRHEKIQLEESRIGKRI